VTINTNGVDCAYLPAHPIREYYLHIDTCSLVLFVLHFVVLNILLLYVVNIFSTKSCILFHCQTMQVTSSAAAGSSVISGEASESDDEESFTVLSPTDGELFVSLCVVILTLHLYMSYFLCIFIVCVTDFHVQKVSVIHTVALDLLCWKSLQQSADLVSVTACNTIAVAMY